MRWSEPSSPQISPGSHWPFGKFQIPVACLIHSQSRVADGDPLSHLGSKLFGGSTTNFWPVPMSDRWPARFAPSWLIGRKILFWSELFFGANRFSSSLCGVPIVLAVDGRLQRKCLACRNDVHAYLDYPLQQQTILRRWPWSAYDEHLQVSFGSLFPRKQILLQYGFAFRFFFCLDDQLQESS